MPLFRRLLLSIVLVAGFILVCTQAAVFVSAQRDAVAHNTAAAEAAVAAVAWTLSHTPATGEPEWHRLAVGLVRNTGLAHVRIHDVHGNLAAEASSAAPDTQPVCASAGISRTFRSADGRQEGWVTVRPSRPHGVTQTWWLSAILGAIVLLSATLWVLFARGLTNGAIKQPLHDIADKLDLLESGRVWHDCLPTPLPELTGVQTAMNQARQRVRNALTTQRARITVLEDELQRDTVTRLPNRKRFLDALRKALACTGAGGHVLIFRQRDLALINRELQRESTDQWLRLACDQLTRNVHAHAGRDALLARLNGSDFAVLLPGVPAPRAARFAARMRHDLRSLRLPLKSQEWCRWALALATLSPGGSASDVLSRLDQALMRAENAGHDHVESADELTEAVLAGEYEWQETLNTALEQHRFFVTLHRRSNIQGQLLYTDALLSLVDAHSGEPMPTRMFMPPAIRLGLSAEVDIQAVRLSLDRLITLDGMLALEIALASLRQPGFLARLERVLDDHPAPSARLILEIDASGLVDDYASVQALCEIAATSGARVGVLRLSRQFAAMERLHQLRLAYVKIAGPFVQSMADSPGNRQLAATVAQTARALGIPAYAEDVPDIRTATLLDDLGLTILLGTNDGDCRIALPYLDDNPHRAMPDALATPSETAALVHEVSAAAPPAGGRAAAMPPDACQPWQGRTDVRLADLVRALEAQRQMNALLSHELRTPAATISAAAQSLELILAGSGEAIDSRLARIRRAVARMTALMDQLLTPERLRDQALTPRGERVDLGGLAHEVVAGLQIETAHRLVLQAEAPAHAWCDPLLIGVVLRNLIHNAIKYSPADEPVHIGTGVSRGAAAETVWLAITDRGPGIDPANEVRIFDAHFRQSAHRETPGVGVGLHLARQICQTQQGSLTMQTEVGQGTRFVITLPCVPREGVAATPDQAANT